MTDIVDVLEALAAAVIDELKACDLPEIDVTTIQPGAVPVLDYVGNGQCAELVLYVSTIYPSGSAFPAPDESASCAVELAYEVNVGILRCAPAMTGSRDKLKPPTPASVLASTTLQMGDMKVMRTAIQRALGKSNEYALRGWQPFGPEGNAVGGTWTVVIGGEV